MSLSRSIAFWLTLLLATGARAGDAPITVTGEGVTELAPDTLRATAALHLKGAQPAKIAAALATREAELRKTLADLGATPASIRFGAPEPEGKTSSDPNERMMQMVMSRMGGAGRSAAKTPAASNVVSISVSVRADWPLKSKEPAALWVEATDTRLKLEALKLEKAVSIDGPKSKEDADEEKEREEEKAMGGMGMNPYAGSPSASSGGAKSEIAILYIAHTTPEALQSAYSAAFENARKKAEMLATGSGWKLGPLLTISGGNDSRGSVSDSYREAMAFYGRGSSDSSAGADERSSDKLDRIRCTVLITAQFQKAP